MIAVCTRDSNVLDKCKDYHCKQHVRLLKRRVETILCELLADEVPTNGWLVASSGLALSLEENRNASGEESDRSVWFQMAQMKVLTRSIVLYNVHIDATLMKRCIFIWPIIMPPIYYKLICDIKYDIIS